jgi:hypothetical protein
MDTTDEVGRQSRASNERGEGGDRTCGASRQRIKHETVPAVRIGQTEIGYASAGREPAGTINRLRGLWSL